MNLRDSLNALFYSREQLDNLIAEQMVEYVQSKPKNLLYISDHAIDRYKERVIGHDTNLKPEEIRNMMLTYEDQVEICQSGKGYLNKDGYTLIVKGITVVTVVRNENDS